MSLFPRSTITNGGRVTLEARAGVPEENPAKVLVIDNSLTLQSSGSTPTGTLDLNDNALVVANDSFYYTYVRDSIIYAYDTGSSPHWDRPGIATSLGGTIGSGGYAGDAVALGYADNINLGKSIFEGETLLSDYTQVLVKWTFQGDANLDGQVDVTDLGALATGWQTSDDWWQGDFNYDLFVDVSDLGFLATNWQEGVGAPLRPQGESNPQDQFLDGIKDFGLSEQEVDALLEILCSGGGNPL
jgi:hypothetical protein